MIINERISGTIECRNQIYELNDSNVISASNKRLACREGAFEIGGVYAATLTLTCRLKEASRFALRGAKITLFSQYDSEEKPYCIGTFWTVNVQKSGEIYTIDAQDAIGWTDVSSYNSIVQYGAKSVGTYLKEYEELHIANTDDHDRPPILTWFWKLTDLCNRFLEAQTGIAGMLEWQGYDYTNNAYFGNQFLWLDYGEGWTPTRDVRLPIYLDNGCADSDNPRDFFSYLAEITGGFVCTDPATGALTLGQFGMIAPGTAEIYTNEMEADYEIADYTIMLYFVYVYGEVSTGNKRSASICAKSAAYQLHSYIHWELNANPFIDGFVSYLVNEARNPDNIRSIAYGIWDAFYHDGKIRNGNLQAEENQEKSKFTVRPFQCRVHAPKRFSLGQQIKIHTDEGNYLSILTSIQWTFRGGHTLACGGEDSRVMADCLRASKSDKTMKETRNRCASIERKIAALS